MTNTNQTNNILPSYVPTNAADARRLANSFAKAQEIIKEGYTFQSDPASPEVIAVIKPNTTAAAYWINLIEPGCDCPDFLNRGHFCKHTLAVEILKDEERMWEAACAEYEARAERNIYFPTSY